METQVCFTKMGKIRTTTASQLKGFIFLLSSSAKGAYDPYTHIYSQEDVRLIIESARVRGIRVMVEFDTPGHTQSWEKGQPGLLTECYDPLTGRPNGKFGPMDPTKSEVFDFLTKLYKEISEVFPEEYVHIGGDEVSTNCW